MKNDYDEKHKTVSIGIHGLGAAGATGGFGMCDFAGHSEYFGAVERESGGGDGGAHRFGDGQSQVRDQAVEPRDTIPQRQSHPGQGAYVARDRA